MADPEDGRGAPPRHIHIEGEHKRGFNWLPWLLLALGLLALLWALSRCSRDEAAVAPAPTASPTAAADAGAAAAGAGAATAIDAREPRDAQQAGVSQVGPYLAGTEATPRTFVFERLNFDTSSSAIRPVDQPELNQIAATLKQYPNSRVRIVGYADARGSEPANAQLGQQRADSVKAALVKAGIGGDRIETGSGGEQNPVDSNATASGQAENRRTELVVLQR